MQLAKSVKFRQEKFGAVLFHTESERVFTLNSSAAAVVRQVRPGSDEDSIVAGVKALFRDPDTRIEHDVRDLLGILHDRGLVTADPR